jgi:hypothetical protein
VCARAQLLLLCSLPTHVHGKGRARPIFGVDFVSWFSAARSLNAKQSETDMVERRGLRGPTNQSSRHFGSQTRVLVRVSLGQPSNLTHTYSFVRLSVQTT